MHIFTSREEYDAAVAAAKARDRAYRRGQWMRLIFTVAVGWAVIWWLAARARGGEADTLPRRPCDAQAAAMQPRLGAPVEYGSKDEALRTLAQAAAREGRPMQVDLLLDGRWQTFMAKPDGQVFVRREGTPPAPPRREVAAPKTFRIPLTRMECEYDESHVCGKCGRVQLLIARFNGDGTHTHTCPYDGHSWRHANK